MSKTMPRGNFKPFKISTNIKHHKTTISWNQQRDNSKGILDGWKQAIFTFTGLEQVLVSNPLGPGQASPAHPWAHRDILKSKQTPSPRPSFAIFRIQVSCLASRSHLKPTPVQMLRCFTSLRPFQLRPSDQVQPWLRRPLLALLRSCAPLLRRLQAKLPGNLLQEPAPAGFSGRRAGLSGVCERVFQSKGISVAVAVLEFCKSMQTLSWSKTCIQVLTCMEQLLVGGPSKDENKSPESTGKFGTTIFQQTNKQSTMV